MLARAEVPPVEPVADEPDDAVALAPASSYTTPPAADGPAEGIPQAELANYLVAHYGYASPLVRRSVGAGLISDDEAALPIDP